MKSLISDMRGLGLSVRFERERLDSLSPIYITGEGELRRGLLGQLERLWRSCPCGSYAPVGTKTAGSSVRASPLLALRGRAACESPDNTMRSRDEKVPLQPDRSV